MNKCLSVMIFVFVSQFFLINSAFACGEYYFVKPKGNAAGAFGYSLVDGRWLRSAYLPAGTLIISSGTQKLLKFSHRKGGLASEHAEFTSEFGQHGHIRLADIQSGKILLDSNSVFEDGKQFSCSDISRLIAPDSSVEQISIYTEPDATSKLIESPSAPYMATMLVLSQEYNDDNSEENQFQKIRFRVGSRGIFKTGFIDRSQQTTEEGAGRWRFTRTLESMSTMEALVAERNCQDGCWIEVLTDLFSSVSNVDNVANKLASKVCGVAASATINMGAEAEVGVLTGWFGISGGVGLSFAYNLDADEIASNERLFFGNELALAIQRLHKCHAGGVGPAKYLGFKFSELEKAIGIELEDVLGTCLIPIPPRARSRHKNGFLILLRKEQKVFGSFVKLRHLIQNHLEVMFNGGYLTDDQLVKLDSLTWAVIGQIVEFQDPRIHGLQNSKC